METNEWNDSIVEEIHKIREQMWKEADCDIQKLFAIIREAEKLHPEKLVDLDESGNIRPVSPTEA